MSLINCPECGKQASDKAHFCPHCGYPFSELTQNNSDRQLTTEHAPNTTETINTGDSSNKTIANELVQENNKGITSSDNNLPNPEGERIKIEPFQEMTPNENDPGEKEPKTKMKKGLKISLIVGVSILFTVVLGLSIFYSSHEHKYGDWIISKKATCTQSGDQYRQCSICFIKDTAKINPLGHDWQKATCSSPKKCSRCNITEGEKGSHQWKDATCTTPKKCSLCGATQGSELGHDFENYTCTRCGYTEITEHDVPDILEIHNVKYEINSVDGIDQWMTFVNKSSSKTIKYIDLELQFYNAVGDAISNEIGGGKSVNLTYTGPLAPGATSKETYWKAIFYNGTFDGTIGIKTLTIEYTDDTVLTMRDFLGNNAVPAWQD